MMVNNKVFHFVVLVSEFDSLGCRLVSYGFCAISVLVAILSSN